MIDTGDMARSRKATILFPPEFYAQLARLAEQRATSVGDLVRKACVAQYGLAARKERLDLVKQLAAMRLPVGTPEEMERESVPVAEPLP